MRLIVSSPTIGMILLDFKEYEQDELACTPLDDQGLGFLPPGFLDHPATWSCPTLYRVARGCSTEESANATHQARAALRKAALALDGRVDVITTDCAWTWYVREAFRGIQTPVIPSSLGLLGFAAETASRVAVVATSTDALSRLMGISPSGVRIVGLETKPEWARYYVAGADMVPPLSQHDMQKQLVERLEEDLSDHGRPQLAILECTALSQFRSTVQSVYGVPVLDIITLVQASMGGPASVRLPEPG